MPVTANGSAQSIRNSTVNGNVTGTGDTPWRIEQGRASAISESKPKSWPRMAVCALVAEKLNLPFSALITSMATGMRIGNWSVMANLFGSICGAAVIHKGNTGCFA